ncbi:unnamed protein product [Closterium sp. NIES-54]
MALRPSSVPLQVPLPSPPASSLPDVPDPESDLACVASPTVPRLLATVVIDPSFESTAASALAANLVPGGRGAGITFLFGGVGSFLIRRGETRDRQVLGKTVGRPPPNIVFSSSGGFIVRAVFRVSPAWR